MQIKFFFLILFAISNLVLYSQIQTFPAACEDKITGQFTTVKETHEYEIVLKENQLIEVVIIPTGAYLNIRTNLIDPVGSMLIEDTQGTFGDPNKRSLTLKSDILSSPGKYKVVVFNHDWSYGRNGRAGKYTILFRCINP